MPRKPKVLDGNNINGTSKERFQSNIPQLTKEQRTTLEEKIISDFKTEVEGLYSIVEQMPKLREYPYTVNVLGTTAIEDHCKTITELIGGYALLLTGGKGIVDKGNDNGGIGDYTVTTLPKKPQPKKQKQTRKSKATVEPLNGSYVDLTKNKLPLTTTETRPVSE